MVLLLLQYYKPSFLLISNQVFCNIHFVIYYDYDHVWLLHGSQIPVIALDGISLQKIQLWFTYSSIMPSTPNVLFCVVLGWFYDSVQVVLGRLSPSQT